MDRMEYGGGEGAFVRVRCLYRDSSNQQGCFREKACTTVTPTVDRLAGGGDGARALLEDLGLEPGRRHLEAVALRAASGDGVLESVCMWMCVYTRASIETRIKPGTQYGTQYPHNATSYRALPPEANMATPPSRPNEATRWRCCAREASRIRGPRAATACFQWVCGCTLCVCYGD